MQTNIPITLLIVEDEPGHAQLAVKCFSKSLGVSPHVFNTGRKALEYLDGKSSEELRRIVVLLDLNMPGMDGCQVLERIKGNKDTCIIPVIVLSSTDSEIEIRGCYEKGANLYLVKKMDYAEYKKALLFIADFIQKFRGA